MKAYLNLIRFFNPAGWLLLYINSVLGLVLGLYLEGKIEILLFLKFMLGAFFTRSGGCVINDILDRNFDKKVERTKERPLASGLISLRQAIFTLILMFLLAFLVLISLPKKVIFICFLSVFFIASYPLFKRFTHFPQVFLGITYSIAFLAGFFAVSNDFTAFLVPIFIALVLWVVIFDTIYAMQDFKDDIKIGVKSTAVFFGERYKDFLYILSCFYALNVLIFWHLAKLRFVIFPILSFVILVAIIKKTNDRNFFKMFKLNLLVVSALCFGILFNYL
jgi:4-hydroxybenzoate polyprenyltransferase